MERISSRQNPLVKAFRDLARGRDARDGRVLLDGPHLVGEALASGVALEVVAFDEADAVGRLEALSRRVERSGARVVSAPAAVVSAMSPVKESTGVVAIARLASATVADVLTRVPQLVVMLDRVQDPGNVGAVIRASEACGATGVVVGAGSADPFGWKALRGAMGSSLRLPVVAHASLDAVLRQARAAGVRVHAAVPRDGVPLRRCDLRAPAAILLGGEGAGISPELLAGVDATLMVPMEAPVESLNVSIAAAVVLYEASRQRADVPV